MYLSLSARRVRPQVAFESEDLEDYPRARRSRSWHHLAPAYHCASTRVDGPIMVDIVEPASASRSRGGVAAEPLPQSARNLIALLEDVVHNPEW